MPSAPYGQIAYRFQPAPNLVPLLPSLMNGSNNQLLDRATSALASVFVGKKFNNDQLTTHGMLLYNQAIQMFLRILPRDGLPTQEVLCTNLIFQLYEVGIHNLSKSLPVSNHSRSSTALLDLLAGRHTCKVPMRSSRDIRIPYKMTTYPQC